MQQMYIRAGDIVPMMIDIRYWEKKMHSKRPEICTYCLFTILDGGGVK